MAQERRRRQDSRDNVPASEGPKCNGDSGLACGLSCPTILDLRRPCAIPFASVAQGQGGRDREQADDFFLLRPLRACAQRRENGSPVSFS